MIYRTAPFSMTLKDPYPRFSRSRHSLTPNISEYRHNFSGILIWNYTHPTQQCHFEWSWVTSKYSVTRSIARSLCNSWASCWYIIRHSVTFVDVRDPDVGLRYLIRQRFVEHSASSIARFLITRKGLSKLKIGEYLGNLQQRFNMDVLG